MLSGEGDGAMGGVVLLLLLWGVPIWATANIGGRKGHPNGWVWGLFLGWIGVVIVALLPEGAGRNPRECPHCLSMIPRAATRCRRCGAEVSPVGPGPR